VYGHINFKLGGNYRRGVDAGGTLSMSVGQTNLFFCKSFLLQPFFRTDYMIPQTFTVRRFLLFSFSVLQFLVVVSVR